MNQTGITLPPTEITFRPIWEESLRQLPNPQLLQGWDWGEFKGRWGWQPVRLLWSSEKGLPLAAAQILQRPIPRTPWRMLYIPRGPVLNYDNPDLATQILADLETYAQAEKALFLKIDPDVAVGHEPEPPSIDPQGQALRQQLLARGWCYSDQQIQFKNTTILDLTPSETDLLAAMKSKWRYNIRLADRKAVVVETGGVDDLAAFFQLYAETAQRDRFLIRPEAYYLDVWRQYLTANPKSGDLLLAKHDGQLIAGLILLYYGRTAWYMYGASSDQDRHLMPNHLLQWEAIKTARTAGCVRYDMWGAPDQFDESDSMWGVYRFKLGFGSVTRQGIGAYDFPIRPRLYQLYHQLLPRLLSLLRSRTQPQSNLSG